MQKNIQRFSGIIAVLFLFVTLVISLLIIWDVADSAEAKEMMIKVALSFGAVFVVSFLIMMIAKFFDKEGK